MRERSFSQALMHSFTSRYISIGIQLIRTTVLARLIAPEDFGAFALSYIVLTIASIIKEFGVNNYLMKETDLSENTIRSAFGLLLVLSTAAATLMYFAAYPVASFYEKPDLIILIQSLTVSLLLSPFGTIVTTLLNKEMNFKVTMVSGVLSTAVSTIIMIILAVNEYGVYTLVIGNIVQTATETAWLWFKRPSNTPTKPLFSGFGSILNYAKFVGLSSMVTQLSSFSTEILTGKYFSLNTVGILNRANSTTALFNQVFSSALDPVIVPYFSKMQTTPEKILDNLRKALFLHLCCSLPFYTTLAIHSETIVSILFGEQWTAVGPLLTILCVSRLFVSLNHIFVPVFMGLGKARVCLSINLWLSCLRIAICILTINYGVKIMLLSLLVVVSPVRLALFVYFAKKELYLLPKVYASWLLPNITISILFAGCLLFLNWVTELYGYESVGVTVLSIVASFTIYGATALSLNQGRELLLILRRFIAS